MQLIVGLDVRLSGVCLALADGGARAPVVVLDGGRGGPVGPNAPHTALRWAADRIHRFTGSPPSSTAPRWGVALDPAVRVDTAPGTPGDAGLGPLAPTAIDPAFAVLHAHREVLDGGGTVVVAAIGQGSTVVRRYRGDGSRWRVDDVGRTLALGSAAWTRALVADLLDRRREGRTGVDPDAVAAGMVEFAEQLSAAGPDQPVRWRGPLRDELAEPFEATTTELLRRREVAEAVDAVVVEVVERTSRAPGPVRLVVGGCGASWPFVAAACARHGQVLRSARPDHDIARGAVLALRGTLHDAVAPAVDARPAALPPVTSAAYTPVSGWPDD